MNGQRKQWVVVVMMALLLVPFAVACKHTTADATPHDSADQSSIEASIRSQIATHYPGETFDIGIDVSPGGEVKLTGSVDDNDKRTRIGEIAQGTEGVTRVTNNIKVSE